MREEHRSPPEAVGRLARDDRADDRADERARHREAEAASLSPKTLSRASVVPEMTAVSKPKSSPPRAATSALRSNTGEMFIAPRTMTARTGFGQRIRPASTRVP